MGKNRDYIDEILQEVNEDLIISSNYDDTLLMKINSYKPWIVRIKEFIFIQKLSLSLICSGVLLMVFGIFGLNFNQINTILNIKISLPFGR